MYIAIIGEVSQYFTRSPIYERHKKAATRLPIPGALTLHPPPDSLHHSTYPACLSLTVSLVAKLLFHSTIHKHTALPHNVDGTSPERYAASRCSSTQLTIRGELGTPSTAQFGVQGETSRRNQASHCEPHDRKGL
jgi:hypothetical protein